jgi:hypothetical protein
VNFGSAQLEAILAPDAILSSEAFSPLKGERFQSLGLQTYVKARSKLYGERLACICNKHYAQANQKLNINNHQS